MIVKMNPVCIQLFYLSEVLLTGFRDMIEKIPHETSLRVAPSVKDIQICNLGSKKGSVARKPHLLF